MNNKTSRINAFKSGRKINDQPVICLVPRLSGIGGMVSFQEKLSEGLVRRGIEVTHTFDDVDPDSILVIGGTRNLRQLREAKRRGIRIVQRLDGMNWIHRVMRTGMRHWLRSEYGNLNLWLIRNHLADEIVYQSNFSKVWWEKVRGRTPKPSVIIHNGVDLSKFKPLHTLKKFENEIHLLLVEGSLLGGYEFGLQNAVYFSRELANQINNNTQVELAVVGKVPADTRESWQNWVNENSREGKVRIKWMGVVDHAGISEVYQGADLLFSADINAACPNAVIESIASGTPVVSFDTGALAELVGDQGGLVVPYGGNEWKVDQPDIKSLAAGAILILQDLAAYRKSARERAETAFNLDLMVDRYIEVLLG
jgi:glycosyltransferase involved in cell wall biosynthesis